MRSAVSNPCIRRSPTQISIGLQYKYLMLVAGKASGPSTNSRTREQAILHWKQSRNGGAWETSATERACGCKVSLLGHGVGEAKYVARERINWIHRYVIHGISAKIPPERH